MIRDLCVYYFASILKELRNCISHIIRVWSLFCLIGVYTRLHFLPILLGNWHFLFLGFLYCAKFHVTLTNFRTFVLHNHCLYGRCEVLCAFLFSLISEEILCHKHLNTAFNNKKHTFRKLFGFSVCKIQFIIENVKHSQDERVKVVSTNKFC